MLREHVLCQYLYCQNSSCKSHGGGLQGDAQMTEVEAEQESAAKSDAPAAAKHAKYFDSTCK